MRKKVGLGMVWVVLRRERNGTEFEREDIEMMEMESRVRDVVERRFVAALGASGIDGEALVVSDELVLRDCGLDSLAFARLVVQLEDDLEGDPFSLAETLPFPSSFGELVRLYEEMIAVRAGGC